VNSEYAKNLRDFADKLASGDDLTEPEIKQTMHSLGLVYTEDEIERLNRVLLALHPISKKITTDNNSKQEISH